MDLVLIVHAVAEGLAGQVEGAEEEVGLFLLEQVEQVAGEAVDGPYRLAARAGHFGQGVENLVD